EGAAGDKEQEHILTVPASAAHTLPGFERGECCTEVHVRHQRISCFGLHSILLSIFSIFGSADFTDSATSISDMMSEPPFVCRDRVSMNPLPTRTTSSLNAGTSMESSDSATSTSSIMLYVSPLLRVA